MITVKTMTESQDAAIMAGAKPVKVTIRYQDYGGYGRSPRKETVKTTSLRGMVITPLLSGRMPILSLLTA